MGRRWHRLRKDRARVPSVAGSLGEFGREAKAAPGAGSLYGDWSLMVTQDAEEHYVPNQRHELVAECWCSPALAKDTKGVVWFHFDRPVPIQ